MVAFASSLGVSINAMTPITFSSSATYTTVFPLDDHL